MSKLIGTAGHVDHGKTTLIRALTGIDADRLPEEKRRGMTIDIGFAYMDLPEHGRVSIVDVPGHEKFITNMLVGALGIDVAMLCVAADEGVMPQTREHFQILELLPVQEMVVAMTRADLADEETRELAALDIQELIAPTRFKEAPIIPVSAVQGLGMDELRQALSDALRRPQEAPPGPWYLPIDRVFAVKGHGVVVTGTLAQGKVAIGDRAFIEPGHVDVRVRAIHSHGDALEASEKGKRTAINLGGVKLEDVHRGQAIGEQGALFPTRVLDARVTWVGPYKHGMRVRVSLGAEEAIGKLFLSDQEPHLAQLRLETEVACALNQPLIIRRYSPPDLVAGGRVAVPQAKPRRKSESVKVVSSDSDEDQAILEALAASPEGVMTDELARQLGRSVQGLGSALDRLQKNAQIIGFAGLWFENSRFDEARQRLLDALRQVHEANPTQAAVPRDRVLQRARLPWSGKPLERLLAALAEQGLLTIQGNLLRDPGFEVQLSGKQRALLERVKGAMDEAGINAPTPQDLARSLGVPPQAVDEMLRIGLDSQEVIRVADGIYYTREGLQTLMEKIRVFSGGKPFTAADLRDELGTSRKYTIPLLEYLDSIRFTMRVGDARVVRESR
jgi:selenocysteine-specific elongation factor